MSNPFVDLSKRGLSIFQIAERLCKMPIMLGIIEYPENYREFYDKSLEKSLRFVEFSLQREQIHTCNSLRN